MNESFETIAINYWEEIGTKIEENLNSSFCAALIIHNSAEFKDLMDFYHKIQGKKLMYISMTKTFDSVIECIRVSQKDFVFIDCVSGGLFVSKPSQKCIYKTMPSNLSEMNHLIKTALEEIPSEVIIIDSLSQFMDFSETSYDRRTLEKFIEELTNFHKQIFLLYDDVLSNRLKNLPILYVEKIIKVEVIKDKPQWQG